MRTVLLSRREGRSKERIAGSWTGRLKIVWWSFTLKRTDVELTVVTLATEMQISVDYMCTWFKSLRDMFIRLDKRKSGDGQQQLTERETLIKDKFGFFHRAVNHRSKSVKSLKAFIAESQVDLETAEWAAAEERVRVEEFDENVTERQPTPALSVSSDMATLQRKAKKRGDMLTMLRDQLPSPEPVTERTTYAAYVNSVLLELSLKDFRRARKGINKVLKPFCESDSTDNNTEDRSNRPPPLQTALASVMVTRPRRNTPLARSHVRASPSASHSNEVAKHLPVSGDHHRPKPFRSSTPRTLPTYP